MAAHKRCGLALRLVLDSLHLDKVTLVGHSIAGDELTAFAGTYPERVDRLVYFDAAFDHSNLVPVLSLVPASPPIGPFFGPPAPAMIS